VKERAIAAAYAAALQSSPSEETAGAGAPPSDDATFSTLGALLDEDVHFTLAGFRDVHGRGNVVRAHQVMFGALSQRKVRNTLVLRAEDSQVFEWTMSAVDSASRKRVVIQGITLAWTRDDGSIWDLHVYFDEARVKAQLGVGPKSLVDLPLPAEPLAPPQEFDQSRSPAEKANLASLRDALDALDANNEAGYLAHMADDVELSTLESAEPLQGKTAIGAYFKSLHKSIGDLDVRFQNGWGIDSFAVAEYDLVGEQRGPIGFVPPGKASIVKLFTVDVAEMREGKIARIRRYQNPIQTLTFASEILK
jgi:ketosteroid isomerase-like protein